MKEKWFRKGVHHYFIGFGITILGCIGFLIDYFLVQKWWMAWTCSIVALIGQGYAWDDLIGDYFGIKTPIKIIDQWLKGNWGFWFYTCKWLDEKFRKEE